MSVKTIRRKILDQVVFDRRC